MTATTPATRRPPFDPELAAVLHARRDEVVTTLAPEEIPGLRARAAGVDPAVPLPVPVPDDGTWTRTVHPVPVAAGVTVRLVLLTPAATAAGTPAGPAPLLYHLHGGGLVTGTADDDLAAAAALVAGTGCAVASVDYRLAPEHPFPAAVEDAYAGLVWLVAQAGSLGLDPARVVVGGISAGGGLAAAVALLARDRGGPALLGQLLVCPMLDDRDSASGRQMQGVGAWDRTANATAWRAYLGDRHGSDDVPGHAAPARAADLTGLPPAFLDVGSAETFRDEVVAQAGRLWAAGGDAELHVWPGGFHGFDALAPDAALSRDARTARRRWLERRLAAARQSSSPS